MILSVKTTSPVGPYSTQYQHYLSNNSFWDETILKQVTFSIQNNFEFIQNNCYEKIYLE